MPDISAQISREIATKEREIGKLQTEVTALQRALSALSGKVATRRGRSTAKKKRKKAGRRAKRGENPRSVLAAMSSEPMAVKEISAKSAVSSPTISAVLTALTKQGKVERKGRGSYRLKRTASVKKKSTLRVRAVKGK